MTRYLKISLAALAVSASSHAYAATATFTSGYIGGYLTNSNEANNVDDFTTRGISKVEVTDGNSGLLFSAPTQGNDLQATITVYDLSNQVIATYTGAINWTIKAQGVVQGIGVNAPVATADGYTLVSPDTQKNYVLVVGSITPNSGTISGSADNKAVDALNAYILSQNPGAPTINGPSAGDTGLLSSAISVNENQTAVTTLTPATPNANLVWSIEAGNEGSQFDIVDGVITFKTAPNYEQPTDADANNTYILTVKLLDSGTGLYTTQQVTVTVLDLVEPAPLITGPSNGEGAAESGITIPEGNTDITTLTSNVSGVKWYLDSGSDKLKFNIDETTGKLTFVTAPNYESPTDSDQNNTYVVVVKVVDAAGNSSFQTVTVTVSDLDEVAPLITGPSNGEGAANSGITIPEGNTDITTLTSNESGVTWSLDGGSDKLKFSIDETTGKLTFLVAPDYENPTDSDHNNTYVVVVKVTDAAGNFSLQTVTVTITNVDEIARKLAEIGGKLRSGLRGYAVHGLSDMLSFNESLMRDNGDEGCASPKAGKDISGRINANAAGANVDLNYSKQLTDCNRPHKVMADAGFTYSKVAGNWNSRFFGALRFETKLDQDVTLGAGLMGSTADDQITGFANSKISDQSLQFNVYARYRITEKLRAGAFAGLGRAWYDFGLTENDGFVLDGKMTGKRHTFGGMLSGDITVGGTTLTTDAIVSRAVEKLGNATLTAQYLGEDRSGIAFAVGTVDVTRISVPVSAPFQLTGAADGNANDGNGSWSRLVLSPGLLCEDNNVDSSALRCGYQLGARITAGDGGRSRYYVTYNWESVADMRRSLVGVGYAYRFGRNLELALELNRGLGGVLAMASDGPVSGLRASASGQGSRAMLNVRIAQ